MSCSNIRLATVRTARLQPINKIIDIFKEVIHDA